MGILRRRRLAGLAALWATLLAGTASRVAAESHWAQGSGTGQRGRREPVKPGIPTETESLSRVEPERVPPRDSRAFLGLPSAWMEWLQDMRPDAQERFLDNNERFKGLPPERQAQIRKRLQHWNSLSPDQRRAVRERERIWEKMTPEQQRHVREDLLPKWNALAPDRRQLLLKQLRALRQTPEAGREAKLNDPAFLDGLSPEERRLLRELNQLRSAAANEIHQGDWPGASKPPSN